MTTSNNTIQAADKEIHEEFERRYAMDADDPASALELGHFVDGWRACISRQRTLAMGAPFMYGIAAPDGTAYIEEFCVSGDRGELQTEVVDQLNRDSLEGSYSVVGLFRDEPPVAQPKMRDALSGMVAIFARGTPPGESPTVDLARSVLAGADPRHADDIAVDQFAATMKAKLAKKRAEGRGGWEDKESCSASYLSQLLRDHVAKGDPVDVGNLAMMLQQRGERITPYEVDSIESLANDPFLAAEAWRRPRASAEALARYCPGCGSVGPVEGEYRDCCPDGDEARMIPVSLANKCRDTFSIAVQGLLADRQRRDARNENVRTGHPFDVPAFDELCREHDVLGTAMSALCAVFWRAAEQHLASAPGDRTAWEADMLAAGATHLGGDCWEWEVEDFEFRIWQLGVRRQPQKCIDDASTSEADDA